MLRLSRKPIWIVLVLCFCWSFNCFAVEFSPFENLGLTEQELVAKAGEPDKKRTISMVDGGGVRAEYPRWEYYDRILENGFSYTMYYTLRDQKVFEVWYTTPTGSERNRYYARPDEFTFIELVGKTHNQVLAKTVLPQNHAVFGIDQSGEMDYYFIDENGINIVVSLQLENGKVSTVRFYYTDFSGISGWDVEAFGRDVYVEIAPLFNGTVWLAFDERDEDYWALSRFGLSKERGVLFMVHQDAEMGRGVELYITTPSAKAPIAKAIWREYGETVVQHWRDDVTDGDFAKINEMFGGAQGGDRKQPEVLGN